jgi:SH3 domain-containing YSC84-like protein 1
LVSQLELSRSHTESFREADPGNPESALNSIPKAVLQRARGTPHIISLSSSSSPANSRCFLLHNVGLAIFQVLKAGFVFSGKAGSGLVIARLPDGSWSAPSCIATGGVGWGLQIGADITDFVIVLNSEDAVRAFSLGGNVTIGGNISAAAGPIGTGGSVQASLAHPAPMFSYSKSKGASSVTHIVCPSSPDCPTGLFAGLSLEGTVLIERKDANKDFYGSAIPARDILGGRVPPPEVASRLYEIIEAAEGLDETGLPDEAYVPTTTGEHLHVHPRSQTVFDAGVH